MDQKISKKEIEESLKEEEELNKLIILANDLKEKMKISESDLENIENQILGNKRKERSYTIIKNEIKNISFHLVNALSQVKNINIKNILEISRYSNPPAKVKMVLEAVF